MRGIRHRFNCHFPGMSLSPVVGDHLEKEFTPEIEKDSVGSDEGIQDNL